MSGYSLPPLCEWHAWSMWSWMQGWTAGGPMPTMRDVQDTVDGCSGDCSGAGRDVCVVRRRR